MSLHARTDTHTLLSEPSAPNKQGTCVLKCNPGTFLPPSPLKPKGQEQVFGDVKCLLWGELALISFSSVSIRAIPPAAAGEQQGGSKVGRKHGEALFSIV